ncbi:HhH-GDP family DNA glycosylase [Arthrobacter woluwensis]|uniref:hypothetical protein n=1 Tax=Arthrobacter woluwensis TaxID=156980 RepID=UPI0011A458F2|nr:hypothetical protein [Arthrobacter woluwensis]
MNDARLVADAVLTHIGDKDSWHRSRGYSDRIDLALINAVLSMRARFGRQLPDGSFNGVRGAVERYRANHPDLTKDWFETLAAQDEVDLVSQLGRAKFKGGKSKAMGIIEASRAFVAAGLTDRTKLLAKPAEAEAAYRSVKGLGPWTFQYFTMLIGADSVKPDVWIIRFVARVVGDDVTPDRAFTAVRSAADLLEVGSSELDHAIWAFSSSGGLRSIA